MNPLQVLETFDEQHMPTLDTTVQGVLLFLEKAALPKIDIPYQRPLVVGSGNALETGRLLFAHTPALFASESSFTRMRELYADSIDGVVLISASGSKHAVGLAEEAVAHGLPVTLFTNTAGSPAEEKMGASHTVLFPKIREPYTYNVSTYMSMLLAQSGEDPFDIRMWIEGHIAPVAEQISRHHAFCFIVPAAYEPLCNMIRTKFDELFGPHIIGRAFTTEEIKHAKTIVTSPEECFITLGEDNLAFLSLHDEYTVSMPHESGPAAYMAVVYYIIGAIQQTNPPYFLENVPSYTQKAEKIFGHPISTIVE